MYSINTFQQEKQNCQSVENKIFYVHIHVRIPSLNLFGLKLTPEPCCLLSVFMLFLLIRTRSVFFLLTYKPVLLRETLPFQHLLACPVAVKEQCMQRLC